MHIVMATLVLALVACVLVMVAFGLFTMTPYAHHLDRFHERDQRSDRSQRD
jgi:hypothetical protein